jgi:hypothetical protein
LAEVEKSFTYDDSAFLNKLIMHISEENCKLSAGLAPNIPEFIQQAKNARIFNMSSEFSDLNERLRKEQMSQDAQHTLVMAKLCVKHNILPFYRLCFDYSFRQFDEPKIKYIGPNFGHTVHDEPYNTLVHPVHFAKGNKWYSIQFVYAEGVESIRRTKQAVSEFIKQDYIVTGLSVKLNSKLIRGEYCDYEESEASLYAGDGKITIYGDIPEDFNMQDLMKNNLQIPSDAETIINELERKLFSGE